MVILFEYREDNTNYLIYQLLYLVWHISHDAYIYNYDIQYTD